MIALPTGGVGLGGTKQPWRSGVYYKKHKSGDLNTNTAGSVADSSIPFLPHCLEAAVGPVTAGPHF